MKRYMRNITNVCRSETGAVTPILMLMSAVLLLSGVAFLGVGASQMSLMGSGSTKLQAQYNAEQAIRISMWRMGARDISEWDTWATFSDSIKSAYFDSNTVTITGVGQFQGITDSVRVAVTVDTITARIYLAHVILYKKSLTLGESGTLNYPFEQNAPAQLGGWGKDHKSKKMLYKHLVSESGKFFKIEQKNGNDKKRDLLHTYNGNQTFDGVMDDGIHIVKGNVHLHDGVVLNGMIAATGHITFAGRVEINAIRVPFPDDYDHYKSTKRKIVKQNKTVKSNKKHEPKYSISEADSVYLPALIALRGTDAEQKISDDGEDMMMDNLHTTGVPLDIQIKGMIFSTRTLHLDNLTLTGQIVGRKVILGGTYNVTFDPKYIAPTPPYFDIPLGYAVGPVTWNN